MSYGYNLTYEQLSWEAKLRAQTYAMASLGCNKEHPEILKLHDELVELLRSLGGSKGTIKLDVIGNLEKVEFEGRFHTTMKPKKIGPEFILREKVTGQTERYDTFEEYFLDKRCKYYNEATLLNAACALDHAYKIGNNAVIIILNSIQSSHSLPLLNDQHIIIVNFKQNVCRYMDDRMRCLVNDTFGKIALENQLVELGPKFNSFGSIWDGD